jgi:hypothetical protein
LSAPMAADPSLRAHGKPGTTAGDKRGLRAAIRCRDLGIIVCCSLSATRRIGAQRVHH